MENGLYLGLQYQGSPCLPYLLIQGDCIWVKSIVDTSDEGNLMARGDNKYDMNTEKIYEV